MANSQQRDRFEAAWVGDLLSLDWCDEDRRYFSQEVQNRWEGFQLGEASGLELAAKVCDAESESAAKRHKESPSGYNEGCSDWADVCAEQIRSLLAREGA